MPEIFAGAVYNVPNESGDDTCMDISNAFSILGGLIYISAAIYLANQEQISGTRSNLLRWLLYGAAILEFLYSLFIFQLAFVPMPAEMQLPQIDPTGAIINMVLTVLICLFSVGVVASARVRRGIRRFLPATASYDPDSALHSTAWVLMLAMVVLTVSDFVVGGGLSGMAESIQTSSLGLGDILYEDVLWIFAALLGVGLLLRRSPQQTLNRLGLRLPTAQDLNWGIGAGLLLIGLVIGFGLVWSQLVSPQELQQQTAASDQLAQSFNTLPTALLISLVVAFGEEIFFRGALQPVFGLWLTSLFFAVLHTQYTLTPATLLIFVVSLILGWLRERFSTSASILAHFLYDFIQLALAVLGGGV